MINELKNSSHLMTSQISIDQSKYEEIFMGMITSDLKKFYKILYLVALSSLPHRLYD